MFGEGGLFLREDHTKCRVVRSFLEVKFSQVLPKFKKIIRVIRTLVTTMMLLLFPAVPLLSAFLNRGLLHGVFPEQKNHGSKMLGGFLSHRGTLKDHPLMDFP